MTADSVQLTDTQQTMLLTLQARAADNRSDDPILGDSWAGQELARVASGPETKTMSRDDAAGALCRAKQLDEWTIAFLAEHPDAVVLHLGCGVDSRVLRVNPPATALWFDVDFPEVVDLRRRMIEPPEGEGYRVIGSSVTESGWLEAVPTDRPTVIVAEGLLMYLAEDDVRQLISRLIEHVPGGRLACDVELPWAARMAKYDPVLRRTGAIHRWGIKNLDDLSRWAPGLRLLEAHPVTALPYMTKAPTAYRRYRWINRIPSLRDAMRVALYEF